MENIKFSCTLTILVTLCCLATPAGGAADTFTPSNLTDSSGNYANQQSDITWAGQAQKGAYKVKTDNGEYDPGTLSYLHTMVDHFLDAVFIKKTPYGKFFILIH